MVLGREPEVKIRNQGVLQTDQDEEQEHTVREFFHFSSEIANKVRSSRRSIEDSDS
jgi:hypothetical protein